MFKKLPNITPQKNTCFLLLVTCLIYFTTINTSKINNIYEIQEISQYLTHKNCLVVFDIDNTLLFPKTDLGSDQWFSHMVEEQTKLGLDINTAIKTVLPIYFHVHFKIDLIPT